MVRPKSLHEMYKALSGIRQASFQIYIRIGSRPGLDYASYSIEDIEGNEWHSCYFNVTYDEAAAIEEAEAGCGYVEPAPGKTSGALAVTASIGMVANALMSALW